MADARDLVIAEFANSEAQLLERIVSLEADVATYRELAAAAFDGLREATIRTDRMRTCLAQLRDECRRLREDLLLADDDDEQAA